MADDGNARIIAEFRANDGRVGGFFVGKPMLLLHHRGRKSGRDYVSPTLYLPDGDDPAAMYIFATMGGAPTNPGWYYNVVSAGRAEVEVGTETFEVTVQQLTGERRDEVYAEQARRWEDFLGYEEKTRGVRTIPVLALRRVSPPVH
ncbi:MAG: hypothetical protein QOE01_347 [Actinomycetota bacterium]|jgi:deazaflavin-dependent oxidoreductase (nitroreductase family)|nr:hypothetical protein [Actinomycetota bacterium]